MLSRVEHEKSFITSGFGSTSTLQIVIGSLRIVFMVCFAGTIRTLLPWMKDNMLRERPELFLQGDTV